MKRILQYALLALLLMHGVLSCKKFPIRYNVDPFLTGNTDTEHDIVYLFGFKIQDVKYRQRVFAFGILGAQSYDASAAITPQKDSLVISSELVPFEGTNNQDPDYCSVRQVFMKVPFPKTPGAIQIDKKDITIVFWTYHSGECWVKYSHPTEASVAISSFTSGRVEGTFEFATPMLTTGYDPVLAKMTDGTFNLRIQTKESFYKTFTKDLALALNYPEYTLAFFAGESENE